VCCSVLQFVAECCSVLQCVAVFKTRATSCSDPGGHACGSVLQFVAVCCSVLQCVAVCCSVLQCVELVQRLAQTQVDPPDPMNDLYSLTSK